MEHHRVVKVKDLPPVSGEQVLNLLGAIQQLDLFKPVREALTTLCRRRLINEWTLDPATEWLPKVEVGPERISKN